MQPLSALPPPHSEDTAISPQAPISRTAATQAARWFVRLSEGLSPAEQRAFDTWLAADASHQAAWQRAMQISAQAGALPAALASPLLRRPQRNGLQRRSVVRSLAALIVAVPSGWAAWQLSPLQWRNDIATATGEQREITLPDGTRVLLDTASAIDIAYTAERRAIMLRAGAVRIATAPDNAAMQAAGPSPNRPFVVLTQQGQVRAIGTVFTVRQYAAHIQVMVTEGIVEVTPQQRPHAAQRLMAGSQVDFTASAVQPVRQADPQAAQWTRGVMAVDNQTLGDVLAELARYRSGLLQCDPAIAQLRISGAFQLADTDAALYNLSQLLPIEVHRRTRYWVVVVPRAEKTAI